MQPTQIQVQRSLEALRDQHEPSTAGGAAVEAPPGPVRLERLPDDVLRRLAESPSVRLDRLEQARERLASGDQPTADDLASRMVGRLVCDRLR